MPTGADSSFLSQATPCTKRFTTTCNQSVNALVMYILEFSMTSESQSLRLGHQSTQDIPDVPICTCIYVCVCVCVCVCLCVCVCITVKHGVDVLIRSVSWTSLQCQQGILHAMHSDMDDKKLSPGYKYVFFVCVGSDWDLNPAHYYIVIMSDITTQYFVLYIRPYQVAQNKSAWRARTSSTRS